MTTDELMVEAEKYNFGEGVPIDYEKAAFYYTQAAEQGNMVAQYNLGLYYSRGTGVPPDNTKCRYWVQKSADQGYEPAKEYLSICEQMDLGLNITVSSHILKGLAAIPYCDISNTALEEFKAALDKSLQINFPTEEQLATRREIYRYLGLITYLQKSSEKEKAYAYFQNGLPISESNDERILYGYLEMLNEMRDRQVYCIVFCSAVEDIYYNAFDKITDVDYKALILRWVVREKCGVHKKPRDIAGAEQANARLLQYVIAQEQGSLTCKDNLRELYKANLNSISNAQSATRQSTNSSTSHYIYKSFWRKVFPMSFGTQSWLGVVIRILAYSLIGIIPSLLALGELIGVITNLFCVAGWIITVLAHLEIID